jgi:predicted O-linked N-acetylglucosamine transferase (SPINDLY family)
MSPESVAHLFQTATRNHQQGNLQLAESGYRAVLAFQPDNPFLLQQLGLLLAQMGRPKEGVPHVERSCRLRADVPAFWNNLGEMFRQVERLNESLSAFHEALRLAPQFPEAHYNLANVLKQLGRHAEAVTHYSRAVQHRPSYDRAWYNLGNTLREEGRVGPAVEAYRQALRLKPDWGDAWLNLANAHFDGHEFAAAADAYHRAVALKPGDMDVEESLGNCLVAQGKTAEAADVYRRANAHRPERWLRALRCDALAPPVVPDAAFIDEYRARLNATLDRYADAGLIDVATLHSTGAEPPMLLTYHGRDDRALKERWAALFAARLPPADPPPRRGDCPRVGFVVTHGHEGVFARCLGDLVARLDRTRRDVVLVVSRAGANVLRHMLPAAKFDFFILPERVDQAAAALRETGFDVLVYWEIGTDTMNYALPLFRPARVQAACWGWPVTSGQPVVDDFISSAALEPPDGEAHYTERLVKLDRLPTYYVRPPVPTKPRPKEAFGFAPADHVYLCQQNVRKYHPDFDPILAGILRADPRGVIGVIADEQPAITELLMTRLRAKLPDVIDRVRVLGRLEREAYLELVAAADVILDTPHYGGGANTLLDAVAAGTPVVTLTGTFHRGRWATAVNRALGLDPLCAKCADGYVGTAVELATGAGRGDAAREKIRQAGGELFADAAAVRSWNQYLLDAVER